SAVLVACVPQTTPESAPQSAPKPNAVVYGTTFQPNTLNPITAPDIVSRSAIEMIFSGLVAANDKGELRPALGESWEESADGKVWTFRLRHGVKWHDGQEFTAEDVKFTYDTVIDPNTKPTVAKSDYAGLQRVEVVDPYAVRFYLAQPNAAFLARLVLGIAPKHLLQGQDLATATFNRQPVGTGPFVLDSWVKGESLTFKRNTDYFGEKPKVEKIVWKIVPDSNVLALQASNGEVDGAPVFNPKDAAALQSSGKLALHETLEGNTQISLQERNSLFQDVRVRQALAYAIDTHALIDTVLAGAAVPATSDILPSSWAYNPDVPTYEYDPSKAKALLADAGWRPGSDGILAKDGKRFSISLMTDAGHKVREQVMLAVRQYWGEVGIEVKASTQERNSFIFDRVLKGDFDAVLLQTAVQIDPDLSRRFHTKSIKNGQNFLNYSNPKLDTLLEQALATSDQQQRKQAYAAAQKILAEDVPQICLFHPKTQYAFKSQLQGIKPSPTNLFWNAEQWEWK
ncbi:MAG TPA: ABC transporter substrate-binding protein, partial [Chloroflexota bacterium]|nr:ABC transporter substrate-binding protein [Chloroflexota bacterium]